MWRQSLEILEKLGKRRREETPGSGFEKRRWKETLERDFGKRRWKTTLGNIETKSLLDKHLQVAKQISRKVVGSGTDLYLSASICVNLYLESVCT